MMEEDGEEEVAGRRGGGRLMVESWSRQSCIVLHGIQVHPVRFCLLCNLALRQRGRRGWRKVEEDGEEEVAGGKGGGWRGGD